MMFMFDCATAFNRDLSSWNVSTVTSMNAMFYNARSFNGNISSWDVSAVTDMGGMLAGATAFDINNKPNSPAPIIRALLKKYVSSSQIVITFSDINVENRNVKSFYSQLTEQNNKNSNNIFTNKWQVEFTYKENIIDNADVGGYSKSIFSHFAKYCLFYDNELNEKKKKELNDKLETLKGDYKLLCNKKDYIPPSTPSTGVEITGPVYDYIRDNNKSNPKLEGYCRKFELLKGIDSNEHPEFKKLSTSAQEKFKNRLYFSNNTLKNRTVAEIWWEEIQNILISEYKKIDCAQKNYNFQIKQTGWIPFELYKINKKISFNINSKLDKKGIEEVFGNINNYYFIVGQMFGKYITQDLPLWQYPGKVSTVTRI